MEKTVLKDIKALDISIGKKLMNGQKPTDNLNHTQIQILIYLIKNQGTNICQKDLEIETHLKKASITGTLDSLQEKGLVERKPFEDDRRKNTIVLSDKALKIKDVLSQRYKEVEKQATKNISDKELESFHKVVNKMMENLK